jgi:hypothetical protein
MKYDFTFFVVEVAAGASGTTVPLKRESSRSTPPPDTKPLFM